jgi:thiosulfate reductase cytochrome b subunit
MRGMRDVLRNEDEKLPPVGRFNAGQKLLFWAIIGCLSALLLTGFVIWRQYFSHFFPIGVIRFSVLAHALFGWVLICAIVVHIYAAIWIKGSVRAMTQGKVTYGWAYKHHRQWFRDILRGRRKRVRQACGPAPAATSTQQRAPWDGGVGPVAGDAEPVHGGWPRHPCGSRPRNRTHPAFDSFRALLVGVDLGRHNERQ